MSKLKRKISIIEGLPRYDKFIRGHVNITAYNKQGEIVNVSKNNLIVYTGREWLLTSLLKTDNINFNTTTGHNNWGIYYISLGNCNPTDPQNPPPSTSTDTGLVNEYQFGSSGNYADNNKKKPIDGVSFHQDDTNDNKYLIAQISMSVEFNELSQGNTVAINEAGLWVADSPAANEAQNFILFARTTFPTINKDDNLALEVLWYLYS